MRYRETLRGVRAPSLIGLFVLSVLGPASAQTTTEAALAELRGLLERQQAVLAEQARQIEAQGRDLQALREQLDRTRQLTPGAPSSADGVPGKSAPAAQEMAAPATATNGQEPQRTPELPAVVSAGEFPGSIRIPGTDAALKIGGQARMMLVHSFQALGTDDRFVTSSIPVEAADPGENARTNYSPAPSRVNIDVRSQTPIGPMRTFIESDFAGSGRAMRLRHAFMQTDRWLFGQTWSTFSDPEAEPIGIDFEGLNAISLFRQPLIRYTRQVGTSFDLAFALENPAPDLTGAQGVNLTPDFIVRARWEPAHARGRAVRLTRTAHIQAAILVRTLRGEVLENPDVTLSTGGFGANVSGVLVPKWDGDDRVKFASNAGSGIGRYITDLGTLGGQDAVYDASNNHLRALPVFSGYIGYERLWRPTFISAVTYGIVHVDNLEIQPDDALQRTHRATINLTWTPIPQFDLVLEVLGGTRINKDGKRGSSSQLQAGWTYRF